MWLSRSKASVFALAVSLSCLCYATSMQQQPIDFGDWELIDVVEGELQTEANSMPNSDVTLSKSVSVENNAEDLILHSNVTSPYPESRTATRSIRLQPGFKYTALDIVALGGNRTYSLRIDEAKPFAQYVQGNLPLNDTLEDGGETAIGTIQGNFKFSSTGAAVYSMPLQIPEGVNGFTPHVELTYNSQSGNGYIGEAGNKYAVMSL